VCQRNAEAVNLNRRLTGIGPNLAEGDDGGAVALGGNDVTSADVEQGEPIEIPRPCSPAKERRVSFSQPEAREVKIARCEQAMLVNGRAGQVRTNDEFPDQFVVLSAESIGLELDAYMVEAQ
jgi:hypothetical protein